MLNIVRHSLVTLIDAAGLIFLTSAMLQLDPAKVVTGALARINQLLF